MSNEKTVTLPNADDPFCSPNHNRPDEGEEVQLSSAENPQGTSTLHRLRIFVAIILVVGAVLYAWLATQDLLRSPPEALSSRIRFRDAYTRYMSRQDYWDAKYYQLIQVMKNQPPISTKEEITNLIQSISPEMLIAFTVNWLGVPAGHLHHFTLFPRDEPASCNFVLTKYEQCVWPLSTLLSLEVSITVRSGKFAIELQRLRRGLDEVALGLAWAYFGSELKYVRNFLIMPTKPFDVDIIPFMACEE